MLGVLLGCLSEKQQLEKNSSLKSILIVSEVLLEIIESGKDCNKVSPDLLEERLNKKLSEYDICEEDFDCSTGSILVYNLVKDLDQSQCFIESIGKIYGQDVEMGLVFSKIFNLIDQGELINEFSEKYAAGKNLYNETVCDVMNIMQVCDDFDEVLEFRGDRLDSKTKCCLCAVAEVYFGIEEHDILSIYELLNEELLDLVERYYLAVFESHDPLEHLEFAIENSKGDLEARYTSIIDEIILNLIQNKKKVYIITDSNKNNHHDFYLKIHFEGRKHYYFCYTDIIQIQNFDKKDIISANLKDLVEIILSDPDGQALVINPELQGYILRRDRLKEILDLSDSDILIN